jgi:hypothetical protein
VTGVQTCALPILALVIVWGLATILSTWLLTRNLRKDIFLGHKLLASVLVVLVLSNIFLLIAGRIANSGAVGYGANKYLLTTIAFSVPLLWFVIVSYIKNLTSKKVLISGFVLLLTISITQIDSQRVPATILAPSSVGFLEPPNNSNSTGTELGVVEALLLALQQNPDQLFCVADYGFPAPNEEVSMDSYFCTRWGQSLTSAESGAWRMVPLDREPEQQLIKVKQLISGQNVIVIRLTNAPGTKGPVLDPSGTWWQKYVNESWEIITVP